MQNASNFLLHRSAKERDRSERFCDVYGKKKLEKSQNNVDFGRFLDTSIFGVATAPVNGGWWEVVTRCSKISKFSIFSRVPKNVQKVLLLCL